MPTKTEPARVAAGILTLVFLALGMFGYAVDPAEQQSVIDLVVQVVGAIIALWAIVEGYLRKNVWSQKSHEEALRSAGAGPNASTGPTRPRR